MSVQVSSETPDWSRERLSFGEWSPGKRLLASIRAYQMHRRRGSITWPLQKWAVLRHRFWSVVSGADIPLNCEIGGGLLLPHPNGIVIHPSVRIGPNCLLMQQVTLGTRGGSDAPVLEGHVDIGAGAKVLGAVHLSAHTTVGANAVVLIDVPRGATVVGIPARIISSTPATP